MSTHIASRRRFLESASAAATASVAGGLPSPAIESVQGANDRVPYGLIGAGARGTSLLRHAARVAGARCIAVCDVDEGSLRKGAAAAQTNPHSYTDYRELLANKDVGAVLIATPLYLHFPMTRDALLAGKHVLCEAPLVFKAEELGALKALAGERPAQVVQVGLQRRYSRFYETARQMVAKGLIGNVTHVIAQWHRNPGWQMRSYSERERERNWVLYREYSGGLTAEFGSHQIDVASWMFGSQPEFVTGVGGQEFIEDGRDIYDNIQLTFRYRRGQKFIYTAISTNQQLPLFGGTRAEFGERILGTGGTIEITIGTEDEPALGLWYYEPRQVRVTSANQSGEQATIGSATLGSTGYGKRGFPILFEKDQFRGDESFVQKELKYARRWLYSRGVMMPEEERDPVEVQLDSFFTCCRTGGRPKAGLQVGLANSTAVILSNLAMEEGCRVYFDESGAGRRGAARSDK